MLQPFLDMLQCYNPFEIALQSSLKKTTQHIKIENQNFNKVFVPHNCHSTLFVGHLI